MRRTANTLFVGNLPNDMRRSEVEDLFEKFGPIVDIDLKMPSRPPGYCFVEFEDPLDAEDAIRYRDGYPFDGRKIRVEWARGGRGSSPPPRRDYASSSVHGGSHNNSNVRRSDYRVIVDGLPTRASWQDLKDHMRRAGDVCFVDVHHAGRDTYGIVEYTNYEDMKYAIYKLDDTEFKNPFGRGFIRVREDRRGRERFSPSPSGSRTRSRSRSPRSYSRSVSRSRSPYRRGSRSRSFDSRRRSLSWSPRRSRSRSVSLSGGADKRVLSRSPSVGKAALSPP